MMHFRRLAPVAALASLVAAAASAQTAPPPATAPQGEHQQGGAMSVTLEELAREMTDANLRGRYMVIPFKGAIGVDVHVEALETVVKRTGGLKPLTCVVLDIDCVGGSDEDAFRMADLIGSAVKQVPVVAYVRQCIGPATMLLFPVREVFVPHNAPAGHIIQFDAPVQIGDPTAPAAGDSGLKSVLDMYEKLSVYDPDMRPLVKALTDPSAHLYTWRGAGDSIEWSSAAPTPAPAGMQVFGPGQLADGMTAKEAVACGLAREVKGGIESIGAAIGVRDWHAAGRMGEQVMRAASKKVTDDRSSISQLIESAWKALAQCNQVAAELPKAELQAKVNEPNVQTYVNPVRAGWLANRWGPMSYTTVLWQQNCDAALGSWRNVANLYAQLDSLMRNARASISQIESSKVRPANAQEQQLTVQALKAQLAALDARAPDFAAGQSAAQARIGWLMKNRGMPPPPVW